MFLGDSTSTGARSLFRQPMSMPFKKAVDALIAPEAEVADASTKNV